MADTRRYDTSWGTQLVGDAVRFRLWGSTGQSIRLRIGDADLPAWPGGDGWYQWQVPGIAPGTPYCFVLEDGRCVPDPAARGQLGDVHGPSLVVDPEVYRWHDAARRPRPWEETVYYELHLGTFTPQGTFRAAIDKLAHLRDLGITAIELMPVGQFAGERGWGYDAALIYAPHRAYGTPDDMKAFVDAAHGHGLQVMLDVIYNHFGPEGNCLPLYAPDFFRDGQGNPWGTSIAYENEPVRRFFIDNALYWLEEYHLDGLRLDAADHMEDARSPTHILEEMACRIRARYPDRHVHLTTEDDSNVTHLHERGVDGEIVLYSGEWNDDFHHVAHVIATGESEGYYVGFVERRWWKLARCLAEGFIYQGELWGEKPRGQPSAHLPPMAFVDFLQNHDQVGNRPFGERLAALAERAVVETLTAMLLLSPHIPLLFMGEEWGETRPFSFFTDFQGQLADTVRAGRRGAAAGLHAFHGDRSSLEHVPDPNDPGSFEASRIDWDRLDTAAGRRRLELTRHLLRLRRDRIVPLLAGAGGHSGSIAQADEGVVSVSWRLNGGILHMIANLADAQRPARSTAGDLIYGSSLAAVESLRWAGALPPYSVIVTLEGDRQALVPA